MNALKVEPDNASAAGPEIVTSMQYLCLDNFRICSREKRVPGKGQAVKIFDNRSRILTVPVLDGVPDAGYDEIEAGKATNAKRNVPLVGEAREVIPRRMKKTGGKGGCSLSRR